MQKDVLTHLLQDVPFDGWTEEAFNKALSASDISKADEVAYFPNGLEDAVALFSQSMDEKMLAALEKKNLKILRIRDRIKTAVATRLALYPSKAVVSKTLTYYAMPSHAGEATNALFRTVDAMWHAAGDDATDFNYYTKRFLLAGVLSSTMLYWLSDESENDQDTLAFLDRRIENVMQIGKTKHELKQLPGRIPFLRMLFGK